MDGYVPDFDNPYPDEDWREITAFDYIDPLILRRNVKGLVFRRDKEKDAFYILAENYRIRYRLDGEASDRFVTAPRGMLTDLASVPRFGRWFVGKVGPHLEAAIVHDFLYVAWQDVEGRGARKADRKFADKLMLAAMAEAKIGAFKRGVIYAAVSSFIGWWVYEEKNADRYRRPPDFEDE
ncbi:MAG: DUF1353 domain-containing protein [Alphaproteobacteria bacterium]